MNVTKEKLLEELGRVKKTTFNAQVETEHVLTLLEDKQISDALAGYDYVRFIAAGGSGMVFEVRDKISSASRALKLSRVGAPEGEFGPGNPVSVELEIEALALVSHQNITRFYNGLELDSGHYAIVTELVLDPKSIDEWLEPYIAPSVNHTTDKEISASLLKLAEVLLGYTNALSQMHEKHQLYHMDIKPGNLLVAGDGTPFVTDLGFARWSEKYKPADDIPVGFTFGFNHPSLVRHGFGIPSTFARAHNTVKAKDLGPKFDLYAFGRTILSLLYSYEERFGERAKGNYAFLYIHLLATLLLDGQNKEIPKDPNDRFASEIAFDLKGSLLQEFTLKSFADVAERFERLLGRRPIEYSIPELDPWYPKSVNHGIGFLNLTPRVQAVIQHPGFRRLREIKQLGNIDEVYSGASHTRFAHTQGVTGMVCACTQALYNDPENPVFKVLVREVDIAEMIVAALLHDLGQSDHGHDLEEIDKAFDHSEIGRLIINNSQYVDEAGRSLRRIVEGSGLDEWGLDSKRVEAILEREPHGLRFHAFRDLLNGPLDADKLDYLVRDSRASGVRHGDAIDVHRLLRCLTILPLKHGETRDIQLRLGIKQKGLSSSEMVVIVRQKMYQSLYLHHAARELKCMIAHASYSAFVKIVDLLGKDLTLYNAQIVRELFTAHLTRTRPSFGGIPLTETSQKKLAKIFEKNFGNLTAGSLDFDWSIRFFEPFCDTHNALLLKDSTNRRLYKRLWERSFADLGRENVERIKHAFEWSRRSATLARIEEEISKIATKKLENKSAVAQSMNVAAAEGVRFENPSNRILLLGDMPFRGLGAGGKAPPILADISRKRGSYSGEEAPFQGVGHIWREGASKMMDEACFCRIFCEPDFHNYLFSVAGQRAVDISVANVLGIS